MPKQSVSVEQGVDMSSEESNEDWVKAATGLQVHGKWFQTKRVLTSHYEPAEYSAFRPWNVSIELVSLRGSA